VTGCDNSPDYAPERNTAVADAGRFTGKAVSFMPVARFETN
jgi:hypothetical protein